MLQDSYCMLFDIVRLVFGVCHLLTINLLSVTRYLICTCFLKLATSCKNLIPFAPIVRLALVTFLGLNTHTGGVKKVCFRGLGG